MRVELVHLLGLGPGLAAVAGCGGSGAGARPDARAAERAQLDRRAEGERADGKIGEI